jgi:hypothetical protein
MLSGYPLENENKGYYDVPINNEYCNKTVRDKPIIANEYNLNKIINTTINDNKAVYTSFQDPTIPSPSLYTETDQSMAGYYNKDPMNLSYEVPIVPKKDSKIYNYINSDYYPPIGIESFSNQNSSNLCTYIIILLIIISVFIFFNR